MTLETYIHIHGGNPWQEHIKLRAGGMTMNYENGYIRYITANNSEIIRMIFFAVREKEWLTIRPEISDEMTEIDNDSFTIRY